MGGNVLNSDLVVKLGVLRASIFSTWMGSLTNLPKEIAT